MVSYGIGESAPQLWSKLQTHIFLKNRGKSEKEVQKWSWKLYKMPYDAKHKRLLKWVDENNEKLLDQAQKQYFGQFYNLTQKS